MRRGLYDRKERPDTVRGSGSRGNTDDRVDDSYEKERQERVDQLRIKMKTEDEFTVKEYFRRGSGPKSG